MVRGYLIDDEEVVSSLAYSDATYYLTLGYYGTSYYLTDHRVIRKDRTTGATRYTDVPLENVVSIDYERRSRPLFFGLGLVGLLASVAFVVLEPSYDEQGYYAVAASLLLLVASRALRRSEFVIRTPNPEVCITIPKPLYGSGVRSFIDDVKRARRQTATAYDAPV